MRQSFLIMLCVFGIAGYAVPFASVHANEQAYGFPSEEFQGGGSSYLGVDTRDVTSDRLGALQLKEERGVEVTMVDQDAPAGKAGIKEHDVILSINSQNVESVEQLRRLIHEIPAGRVVTVGLSRNGQLVTVKATLADRQRNFSFMTKKGKAFELPFVTPMPEIDVPVSVTVVHSSIRSGLMVENLTPQLGEFFGVKNGQGVLVRSVEKGSRAEKAGFRAGDVVVRINGEPVNDTGDFTHALRSRKDSSVKVDVVRDKKEQAITLSLPEHKQSEMLGEDQDMQDMDVGVETNIDLSEIQDQMAKVRPQIDLAMQQARKVSQEAREEARKELEKQREGLRKHQKELRKQEEEVRKQIRDEMKKVREEIWSSGNEI